MARARPTAALQFAIGLAVVACGCDKMFGIDPIDPDASPKDRDGDLLSDENDNCPDVANADQHDEDADLRGDACDVCPHLVEIGADDDDDGVGNACDPNPATTGDHFLMFDGFRGTELADGWQSTIAPSIDADRLILTSNPGGPSALLLWVKPPRALASEAVVFEAKVTSLAYPGNGGRTFGVVTSWVSSPHSTYACDLADNVPDPDLPYLVIRRAVGATVTDLGPPRPFDQDAQPGPGYFRLARAPAPTGTTLACAAQLTDVPGSGESSMVIDATPLGVGVFGLRGVGVVATLDWVIAIASPSL